MNDQDLILRALYEALEGCYSPQLKAEYQRLIDKMEGGDDEQQRLDI